MFEAQRPVKSSASELHMECEKLREENAKYRKKVQDFQMKFSRLGDFQESNKDSDIMSGLSMKDQHQLKKTISDDKVIGSIQKLLEKSKTSRDLLESKRKELKSVFENIDRQVKELESDLEAINRQTREAEREFALKLADHKSKEVTKENRHDMKAKEKEIKKDHDAKIRNLDGQKTNATANRGEKTQRRYERQEELKRNQKELEHAVDSAEIFH